MTTQKLWHEICPYCHWSCTRMATPPTLCSTVWGGTWYQPTVSSETLRCLRDTQSKGSMWDMPQDGGITQFLPGSEQDTFLCPTDHTPSPPRHSQGWNPAWPDQSGWEILPKALQPSKHGTIQHWIILKVKIVYCCLCRNALTSPVLFLYLAVGLQA